MAFAKIFRKSGDWVVPRGARGMPRRGWDMSKARLRSSDFLEDPEFRKRTWRCECRGVSVFRVALVFQKRLSGSGKEVGEGTPAGSCGNVIHLASSSLYLPLPAQPSEQLLWNGPLTLPGLAGPAYRDSPAAYAKPGLGRRVWLS